MAKCDEFLALYNIADAKGFDVMQSNIRDHVGIDGEGDLVKIKNGGAAFSDAEARRYLEELPDWEG